MQEYKVNMILDSGNYKISYSKNGKQNKVTIVFHNAMSFAAMRRDALVFLCTMSWQRERYAPRQPC